MTLLQLQKRRDDAMAAVSSATSDKARTKALSDLEASSLALAAFQSKTVKTVKKEERYEEVDEEDEDEDEEESDEDSDDEPKKPASGDDDDDDDSDDDDEDDDSDSDEEEDADEDEDEEEDEDAEEDEKAAAAALHSARTLFTRAKRLGNEKSVATARAHLKAVKRAVRPKAAASYARLRSACVRITGKKGIAAIIGALDGLRASATSTEKLAGDVARIKAKNRREKVDAMLTDARRAGKVAKGELVSLRSQGIKDPKWLRGYLSTLASKRVRTLEDGVLEGKSAEGSEDADASRSASLDAQHMSAEQRKAIEQMAASAGQDFDEFLAAMNKTASKTNGASRRAQ